MKEAGVVDRPAIRNTHLTPSDTSSPAGASTRKSVAAANSLRRPHRHCSDTVPITMTLDLYGHMFPKGDDRAELAKSVSALLG